MPVDYYSNHVHGRHLGLVRHRTGADGSGIDILTPAGWMRAARHVGQLLDMDRVHEEVARDIAIGQFRLELVGRPLPPAWPHRDTMAA